MSAPMTSAAELAWEDLALPLPLPALTLAPTPTQVFMFSAVTWNRHHIHYSPQAAQAEGHSDIVVQRGLIGDYLARLLTGWLGERGEIRTLSWKMVRSALPSRLLRCEGEVTAQEVRQGSRYLHCAVRVVDAEGNLVAEGAADLDLTEAGAHVT